MLTFAKVKHIRQAVEDNGIEPEPLERRVLGASIQGVPFFWGSTSVNYENLQPLPSQVSYIWETFVENVDPFIKVLHVPTIGRTIKEAKGESNRRKGSEISSLLAFTSFEHSLFFKRLLSVPLAE